MRRFANEQVSIAFHALRNQKHDPPRCHQSLNGRTAHLILVASGLHQHAPWTASRPMATPESSALAIFGCRRGCETFARLDTLQSDSAVCSSSLPAAGQQSLIAAVQNRSRTPPSFKLLMLQGCNPSYYSGKTMIIPNRCCWQLVKLLETFERASNVMV